MTLGDKIKQLRSTQGLTQDNLAKVLEVARTAICNWEKNINKPNVDLISKMCFIFDVSPNYFFDVPDKKKSLVPAEAETREMPSNVIPIRTFTQEEEENLVMETLLALGFIDQGQDLSDVQIKIAANALEILTTTLGRDFQIQENAG